MPQKSAKVKIDTHKWTEGRVAELYAWTETLYSLRVEADVEDFEAGQFGRLGLIIGDEFVTRSYSFVNAPRERPLDFYFNIVPEGVLTKRMITLKPGDAVWTARKPAGFLTLSQLQDGEHLWLLSTGTAIGPFLSILKTEAPWRRFRKIVLVHAVRTAAELAYGDTIRRFRAEHPGQFMMIPFVSRERQPEALEGRIPQAISDGRLEARTGIELKGDKPQVMICGSPDMVRDTTRILVEKRGLRENRRRAPGQVSTERYW